MKVHVLTVIVIDLDDIGAEGVRDVLENTRYPNHCIAPNVQSSTTYDVGPWDDDHPLNQRSTDPLVWLDFAAKIVDEWEAP